MHTHIVFPRPCVLIFSENDFLCVVFWSFPRCISDNDCCYYSLATVLLHVLVHTHTSLQKQETYTSITRPLIQQWLQMLEKVGDGVAECVIVYCITAEVRAKRQRTLGNLVASSHVMEGMRNDFKSREYVKRRREGGVE